MLVAGGPWSWLGKQREQQTWPRGMVDLVLPIAQRNPLHDRPLVPDLHLVPLDLVDPGAVLLLPPDCLLYWTRGMAKSPEIIWSVMAMVKIAV